MGLLEEEQHDLYIARDRSQYPQAKARGTQTPARLHKARSPPPSPGRAAELAARPGPGRARAAGLRPARREGRGDRGQLRVGPRRERLAHSQVEFVLGQHTAHERGLRVPITCSRSASDTRRYPRPAADAASSSPGPVTIAAPQPSQSRGSLTPSPSWRHPRRCHDREERADVTAGEAITARRRKPAVLL